MLAVRLAAKQPGNASLEMYLGKWRMPLCQGEGWWEDYRSPQAEFPLLKSQQGAGEDDAVGSHLTLSKIHSTFTSTVWISAR